MCRCLQFLDIALLPQNVGVMILPMLGKNRGGPGKHIGQRHPGDHTFIRAGLYEPAQERLGDAHGAFFKANI